MRIFQYQTYQRNTEPNSRVVVVGRSIPQTVEQITARFRKGNEFDIFKSARDLRTMNDPKESKYVYDIEGEWLHTYDVHSQPLILLRFVDRTADLVGVTRDEFMQLFEEVQNGGVF